MRTLGATAGDVDLTVVDGIESVRQRVEQRLRFWSATWFANQRAGVPYLGDVFLTRQDGALARRAVTDAVLSVPDVTGVRDIETELTADRRWRYHAVADTVYGPMDVDQVVGGQ